MNKTKNAVKKTRPGGRIARRIEMAKKIIDLIEADVRLDKAAHRRMRIHSIYANALIAHVSLAIEAAGLTVDDLPAAGLIGESWAARKAEIVRRGGKEKKQ